MIKYCMAITGCLIALFSFAQAQTNYSLTMGKEIKMKRGAGGLDVVNADNTGLYFTESRILIPFGATVTTRVKLIKLDENFREVFDKEYKKELRGLSYHSF